MSDPRRRNRAEDRFTLEQALGYFEAIADLRHYAQRQAAELLIEEMRVSGWERVLGGPCGTTWIVRRIEK